MKIKSYKSLGTPPVVQEASIVIVEDDHGNPISFVSQHGGYYVFSSIDREDFQRMLQSVGLDKTVIVTRLDGGEKDIILPK